MSSRARTQAALVALMLAAGCGREADLSALDDGERTRREEPRNDSGFAPIPTTPDPPEAGVPMLLEISAPSADECTARGDGCPATNDFVCVMDAWLTPIFDECRAQTGCGRDWFSVELTADGCPVSVGMTVPHAPFAQCVLDRIQAGRCPCRQSLWQFYLGDEADC